MTKTAKTAKTADKLSAKEEGLSIDPEKKSATKADVLKAWQPFVSNADELKLETFKNVDGGQTTRLFNNVDNSTVAEAHGSDALLKLYEHAGNAVVEPGKAPAESDEAEPHPAPASGIKPNKDQVVVSDEAAQENPGTAVAEARKDAGKPISE